MKKELIVYFPNWKTSEKNGRVEDIPWDKITYVNHAFWKVSPIASPETGTVEWRKNNSPRTEYRIMPYFTQSDDAVFEAYKSCLEKNPDVKIMLSIGGWCASGFFSEMAYTKEGRNSFIEACISFLEEHPQFAGIDIDWEYPGGGADEERLPEGPWSEGCPVFGSVLEDKENFTTLFKEMREAFSKHFKKKVYITSCAAGWEGVLRHQDWKAVSEIIDYVNIMTYDYFGLFEGLTGHSSGVNFAKGSMEYFLNAGVKPEKINIGAAFYGKAFLVEEGVAFENVIGAKTVSGEVISNDLDYSLIRELEKEASWKVGFDEVEGGAYLYNDDKDSNYYRNFVTYDNEKALLKKAELVNQNGLAGIIVWEITQDTADNVLVNIINEGYES